MMRNYSRISFFNSKIPLLLGFIIISIFNSFAKEKTDDIEFSDNETGKSIHAKIKENFAPLTFITSSPTSGATGVARNANIDLVFNEAVATGTVTTANIKIIGSQTGLIAATLTGGGTTQITINPTTDFKAGELITVTVLAGLQSQSTNQGLTNPYTVQFTVGATANNYFTQTVQEQDYLLIADIAQCKSFYPADIDGDGDLDVAAISEIGNYVIWYENDGTQNFTSHTIPTSVSGMRNPHSIVVSDINNDGFMDITVSDGGIGGALIVLINNGSETFTEIRYKNEIILEQSRTVSVADMNNNGNMDVLSYGNFSGVERIFIFPDFGQNSFSGLNDNPVTLTSPWGMYVADVNSDGYLDVVSGDEIGDQVAWYQNNGAGSLVGGENLLPGTADRARGVFAIDIDGDGDLDLLSASVDDGTIAWYNNDGSENFTKIIIDNTFVSAQELDAADIDGDGDIDVVAVSNNSGLVIYLNNGNEVFTKQVINTTILKQRFMRVADMDGDGDLDILATSVQNTSGKLYWFENKTEIPLSFVSSTPANAATDVTGVSNIVLTFDEKVKASTVNSTNIVVTDNEDNVIAGTFTGQGTHIITFTPDLGSLPYAQTVNVTLNNELTSVTDNALTNPTTITFTIASESLSFLSMTPADNALNVAVDAAIVLNFDANVLGSTVNDTNIVVTGSSSGTISGTFSGQNTNQITFTPSNAFVFDEDITVVLTDGLTTSSGGVLTNPTGPSGLTFTTENLVVRVSPKVFLQGPFDTVSGLMNDNLRIASVIPTTSPYADALTANATVFSVTGSNAIVDWVYIELRDKTNITTVISGKSAFVQRDGDVVGIDGISPVEFALSADNYYVSISHRNHIAIATDVSVSLTATTTTLDFTNNTSIVRGNITAVNELTTGIFGMFAGDFNTDGQINSSDFNLGLISLGLSGYLYPDFNMNGEVQVSDITPIFNLFGKGKQF